MDLEMKEPDELEFLISLLEIEVEEKNDDLRSLYTLTFNSEDEDDPDYEP
jgi:hypothetical protein